MLIATLERAAASWCDRLVTVSRFHREWALRLGIASTDKIVAIPNGIESIPGVSEEKRRAVRERLCVRDDELLILSLGRLAEQKGFEDLLKAVTGIRSGATRPFKIKIAGEGPKKADLQLAIERYGIADTVELIGFSRDVEGLFGAADLVVQPSLWEGLSISLLEAMSAGKAVVTTAIASNIEVVGKTECAVLVPPQNPAALARATLELMNDDAFRRRVASRAREVFNVGYTRRRMHDDYMVLYRTLLPAGETTPRSSS
jgi:glycosyltransferase involved in cell wall biosynthesis